MKGWIAFAALLLAPTCFAGSIKLDDSTTLKIETDNGGVTTVSILYAGDLQESVSIGNSMFDQSAVKFERLCQGCDRAYLIPIPDASSTYGAQTFLVVYKREVNWSMQKLPIAPDLVKPAPTANYFLLDDGIHRYEFKHEMLIKVK